MAQLAPLPSPTLALPALIASADDRARLRFLEFFAVTIRNAHTRRAYARPAGDFLTWVAARGVTSLGAVQPPNAGAWIEAMGGELGEAGRVSWRGRVVENVEIAVVRVQI